MKTYIVAVATKYTDTNAYGIRLGDVIYQNFNNFNYKKITNISEVKEDGITAVIYEDTPFVTPELLQNLKAKIEGGENSAFKIGQGFIKKSDAAISDALATEILQINSFKALEAAVENVRGMIFERHFENGVTILDFKTTFIEFFVKIGKGTVIHPMNYLRGKTEIGENATILPYNTLIDTTIGSDTDINASFATQTSIGSNCTVGPFATFRKGAVIKDRCRVGDYVEIKNSVLENDVKAAHLAYVGDSFVGENTNIGCGVVFANYDGKVKRSVHVGKNVFIGCNTNLVAPITVEDNAFIAAGGTVTQDVPANSLCIARVRQTIKTNWKRKD